MVVRTLLIVAMVMTFLLPIFAQAEVVYKLIDLGTLGGDWSVAYSVNDVGQIVGTAMSEGWTRATLFDATGAGDNIDLGTLGGYSSAARCINNAGQIVGEAMLSEGGIYAATLFDPTGAGNNLDLGTLGGQKSWAVSINNTGQIVGRAEEAAHNWAHATLFDATGGGDNMDLGTLGGGLSAATSINDAGQIVGEASDSQYDHRATLFDPTGNGSNVDLGAQPGNRSEATYINNSGRIGGWFGWEQQGRIYDKHPTLFDPTGAGNNLDVGTAEGAVYSINDTGQTVGREHGHATVFDLTGSGKNIDLNTLIDPASGWTLRFAYDINNKGWIVGQGWNSKGKNRAFLLVPAYGKYSGGSGTAEDPYQILTAGDMQAIGAEPGDWDRHFVLVADIDLSAYTGTSFNIIGRDAGPYDPNTVPFAGVFNGDGHTISGFTYDSNGVNEVGMCGYVDYGKIENLGLIAPTVVAGKGINIGSLVGDLKNGSVVNCYVEAGVVSGERAIGGLVGHSLWGVIVGCRSSASVTGRRDVGGLIGDTHGGSVMDSHSAGNVMGDGSVGGFVGSNGVFAEIRNCYAMADVTGIAGVGGLAGYNSYRQGMSGKISCCYAIGRITGNEHTGGLVGSGYCDVAVDTCFWDTETSGMSEPDCGVGKTTAEMKQQSTFDGWDFVNVWDIGENQTYPFLRTHSASDVNKDGIVNFLDLCVVADQWMGER